MCVPPAPCPVLRAQLRAGAGEPPGEHRVRVRHLHRRPRRQPPPGHAPVCEERVGLATAAQAQGESPTPGQVYIGGALL